MKKSYFMLISSMLIVSTIGLFRRYIPLSSALLAFFRGLIGSFALCLFSILHGRRLHLPAGKLLAVLALNGAFIGINWILLFEAYNRTTIAKATVCYYLQPTIVLLLSPAVFGEKLTVRKLLCAAAAIAGMFFVSGAAGNDSVGGHELSGILFGLGAAVFYALVVIINKKIEGVGVYEKTAIQLLAAAIVLLPYLLADNGFRGVSLDSAAVCLLLTVGVVHTGGAYTLYFGSVSGLSAQTVSMLSYIDPVAAMIISALVLREPLTLSCVIGALLILGSAIVSEIEPKQKAAE